MLRQEKQKVAPGWLPRASWVALVSLAWMQLAIAGHQFEHSAAYTDFCDVCVQVDRLDDVIADQHVSLALLRPEDCTEIPRTEAAPDALIVAGYSPRAPPFV